VPVPKVAYPLAAVSALTFSPDGKRLALGTFGQVVVYDTATWQPTVTFTRVVDAVRALAFTPDGKTLAVGCGLPARNGQTFLWDLSPSGAGRILVGQKDAVETIAFSKDGKQALIGADDNTVRWFQDRTSFQFHNLDEHNGRVQAVAFSPRNSWIFITGAADHLVKVWDPRNWHTVINFDQSESGIVGLAFQNNGDQFVGASLDGKLYWWGVGYDKKHDTFGGYLYRVEMAHPDGVYAMSMCADGSRFITCGADNTVGVWNAGGGRIRTFKEADQPLYAVALSPDGKLAAGGGRSGLLYLWDVETSKLLSIVAPPPLPAAKTAPTAPKPALKQVAHVAKRGAH
jgi:WD40 repeat protein